MVVWDGDVIYFVGYNDVFVIGKCGVDWDRSVVCWVCGVMISIFELNMFYVCFVNFSKFVE